jgi:hypothetical protein
MFVFVHLMLYIFHAIVFRTLVLSTSIAQSLVITLLHVSSSYYSHHQGGTISPLHQKQEASNTVRCLETAAYVLTYDIIFK